MRLDTIHKTANGKTYTSHLIREAYRDNGRVRHRTIANLSGCSDDEIEAIRLALKHKGDLANFGSVQQDLHVEQGLSVGAVFALSTVAKRLRIDEALGNSQEAKQAFWQVLARIIDQGSRLSAVRLAGTHAACDVLGLEAFDEDDLYANLDWLWENQAAIEDRLFRHRHPDGKAGLFLYDVTSSYLEGVDNELAAFGYNRDGKRGKRQIVIGLLCDEAGCPLSVEVFSGNTADTSTFASQVRKVADRFGGGAVTLVGDRGMIKGPQVELLQAEEGEFHYITAITKPQIESLLKQGLVQLNLFDERLAEVTDNDTNVRYILRRNPQRAEEMAAAREGKFQTIAKLVAAKNIYLAEHPRASVEVALRDVQQKIDKLRLSTWLSAASEVRTLSLVRDEEALAEVSKLDGCYCLRTDLTSNAAPKEVVHDRYKSLADVEWAFRTCKTSHLEVRPIFVRKESRTRGHVFVVMLAYQIIRELARCWQPFNLTVAEGISELSSLCMTRVTIRNQTTINQIPTPRPTVQQLLASAEVVMPQALPYRGARVYTKKKLSEERKVR
ncbi:MAG: IS1634 family transposase [Pseudomonadota bacterium]|nr:IS1634 family transposase [Pseudomonadota bacterium]